MLPWHSAWGAGCKKLISIKPGLLAPFSKPESCDFLTCKRQGRGGGCGVWGEEGENADLYHALLRLPHRDV